MLSQEGSTKLLNSKCRRTRRCTNKSTWSHLTRKPSIFKCCEYFGRCMTFCHLKSWLQSGSLQGDTPETCLVHEVMGGQRVTPVLHDAFGFAGCQSELRPANFEFFSLSSPEQSCSSHGHNKRPVFFHSQTVSASFYLK